MTRVEIEKEALSLPLGDRAALLEVLRASLIEERGLTETEQAEFLALRQEIDSRLALAFAGEAREWSEDDWESLLRGEYQYPLDSNSQAVPPGWKSRRLTQSE